MAQKKSQELVPLCPYPLVLEPKISLKNAGVCVGTYTMFSSHMFYEESKASTLLILYTVEIRRGNCWYETEAELKMLPFCQ